MLASSRLLRNLRRSTGSAAIVLAFLLAAFAAPVAQAQPTHRAVVGTHYARVVPACAAPRKHQATCFVLRRLPAKRTTPGAVPYTVTADYAIGPAGGYTPADLWKAYGLGTLSTLTAASGPGSGQTVGIVDAYDTPSMESDLATFDAQYGLPACTTANGCFTKVSQTGSTTVLPSPAGTSGWDRETSLDVEAVHAICPDCKILLVEANSPAVSDTAAAVNEAVLLGATEISNSYGGAEFPNSTIQADYDHPGVVITASAGDNGYFNWDKPSLGLAANTPAAYPNVVAVGGTALDLTGAGARADETVWNDDAGPSAGATTGGTGGGCSKFFNAPLWQSAVVGWSLTGCSGYRLVSDVAALGDPLTGFDTYDSYNGGTWQTTGGTSLSSPIVAAMYALAGGAQGVDYPAQTLYSDFASNPHGFFDVVTGGNGYCYGATSGCTPPSSSYDCSSASACGARTGYDGPSGVGVPAGLTNLSPVLGSFTLPATADPGTSVSVDGSASSSLVSGDTVTSWHWNWGDGSSTTTSTPTTSHPFTQGIYTVSLTVTTQNNHTSQPATHTINVGVTPPSSSSAPTITGTAADLATLTEHHATWDSQPTSYSYQWQRCDSAGANCADLPNATAQIYHVVDADTGHTIRVREIATNGAGDGSPASSAVTAVIASAPAASTLGYTQIASSPLPTGGDPTDVAVSPSGQFVAVSNYDDDTISVFSLAADGTLTEVPGSPFDAGGRGPQSIDFSPDSKLLAVDDYLSATIMSFSVGGGGALTPVAALPTPSSPGPNAIAFSPNGNFIAVADTFYPNYHFAGAVHMLQVDSEGNLNEGRTPAVTSLNGGDPTAVAFSPDGNELAVGTSQDNLVHTYAVGGDGSLTQMAGSPYATGAMPRAVAFTPGGSLLSVANLGAGTLSTFAVGSGGALSQVASSPSTNVLNPVAFAFSPAGGLLATAAGSTRVMVDSVASDGSMSLVSDEPSQGFLTSRQTIGSGQAVAFDPTGRTMVVTDQPEDQLLVFHQDQAADAVGIPVSDQYGTSVSGIARVGQIVSGGHGMWTNSPTSYSDHWQRCDYPSRNCADISGATGTTYQPVTADVGHTLRMVETATNASGTSRPDVSGTTAVVSRALPPSNIAFAQVSGSPVATGNGPRGVAISPSGNLLAVANSGDGTISVFTLSSTGALTPVAGSPFAAGTYADAVTFSPNGQLLAVANSDDGTIATYTVAGNGALTPAGSFNAGSNPSSQAIAFSPDGSFLAVADDAYGGGIGAIHMLHVSPTGALTEPSGPAMLMNAVNPSSVAFNPSGGLLAVTGYDTNKVNVYAVAADGSLTAAPGSPHRVGIQPSAAAFSPDGTLLTVPGNGGLTTFTVGSGGTLTPVVTSPSPQASAANSVAFSPTDAVVATAGGRFALADEFAADGAMQPLADESEAGYSTDSAGTGFGAVTFSPDGSLMAVTGSSANKIYIFARQAVTHPVNTSLPTITGSAVRGQTLTEQHGGWTNSPTSYSYQWESCQIACSPISGATSQTYTPGIADVGHTIVVQEVATNASGSSATVTSAPTAVVKDAPPVNSAVPTITGTAVVGGFLTGHLGSWTNAPTSYTHQWQRCDANGANCTDISGATQGTYTVADADQGHTLLMEEWAGNSAGQSTVAASAPTAVVPALVPVNTSPPSLSGSAQPGGVLTESHGIWTNSPTSYSYQWERCSSTCTPIAGATGQTYTLVADDLGLSIAVQEVASNANGASAPATSNWSAIVSSPPVNTGPPSITGSPQVGGLLTEQHGTWQYSPTFYGYKWQRCDVNGANCTDIAGATQSTYSPTSDDFGHTILVEETAANYVGGSGPVASAPTAVVTMPVPANTAPPTIGGTPASGSGLGVQHGAWSGSPTSYTDQWARCDINGANCSDVSGATGSTYTLSAADVGHRIVVVEVASNAAGAGSPAQSAATGVVQGASVSVGGSGTGSALPPTPPPPSTTNSSPPAGEMSATQVVALLNSVAMPKGKSASITTLLKNKGFTFSVNSAGPGTLVTSWYFVPSGAHISKAKAVVLATGKTVFTKAGTAKLVVKLTAAGKRMLGRAKSLALTTKTAFTPAGGNAVVVVKSVKLKR